jgi:hypothetical protein
MFSRKIALPTTAAVIAVAVITGPATSARAAGPTSICYTGVGVNQTIAPGNSVSTRWALDSRFVLTGAVSQNSDGSGGIVNPYITAWWTASTSGNFLIAGGKNDSISPARVVGFLVVTWTCS